MIATLYFFMLPTPVMFFLPTSIEQLLQADDETRKRIVDFALGLCFAQEGQLNKVSDDVLLMTPHTVTMDEHAAEGASAF